MISYKLQEYKNKKSDKNGWVYARAIMTDTITLDGIADRIQRNCSMKASDVKGVLTELVEVMNDELQASHRVVIDGLGSFKISLHSTLAENDSSFSPTENIVGMKVLFQPKYTVDQNGQRTTRFVSGSKVKMY